MLVFSIQRLNMFLVRRLIAIGALIPPGYLIESAKRDGSNSVALILHSLKSRNPHERLTTFGVASIKLMHKCFLNA